MDMIIGITAVDVVIIMSEPVDLNSNVNTG
jgi:hypothetical protein